MAFLQRWYEFGNTFGMRYLFEGRGDGLAMHRHPQGQEHNVIVLRGAIQVTGKNEAGQLSPGIRVDAPAIIDILPEWHEIVALEPGTELLNIYKSGKPPEYEGLPESEKNVLAETRPLENPL